MNYSGMYKRFKILLFISLFLTVALSVLGSYSDLGAMGTVSAASTSDSANITVKVYKWKKFDTGADIRKTKEFKIYNKKGLLTQQLFNRKEKGKTKIGLASKGTVVFKFQKGEGPKTIVIAGTHGDEYASQAAALKLLNFLDKNRKKIKGTVYVIPISNPKATVKKSRTYFGYDPNRVVGKKSSFTGHIMVNIILKEKIKYVGDFHTMVGGTTLIYAAPYSKSKKISKTIANKLNHNYKISPNKGTITRTSAEHGLVSFTGEVQSKRGAISPGRDKLSYKQMICFLRIAKNI